MPIWGALGSAAISAVGNYLGSSSSAKRSAKEAKKNRQWQEQMSNTSYQRATTDLKAAGLNPMLAYSQGGAGTPSGAVGTVPDMGDIGSDAVGAYQSSSANRAQRALAAANVTNIQADTLKKEEEKRVLQQEERLARYTADKTETTLPFAARDSMMTSNKVRTDWQKATWELDRAVSDARKAGFDASKAELDLKNHPELLRLGNEAIALANKLKYLDVPESEANAAFWNLGGENAKILEKILSALPGGSVALDILKKGRSFYRTR